MNCWWRKDIERCITCLKNWDALTAPERMQRARDGYGSLTSKPYGWVNDTGFTVVEALDADGNSTLTLVCRAIDAEGEVRLVRVLAIEDFYEALQKVHEDSAGMPKGETPGRQGQKRFGKVPRWASDIVVKGCVMCTMRPSAKPRTLSRAA